MYVRGAGVEKNLEEAYKWFKASAEKGDVIAQYHLGLSYFEGEGVKKDLGEAYFWLALASAQGDHYAQHLMNELEPDLSAKELTRLQKKASEWRSKL